MQVDYSVLAFIYLILALICLYTYMEIKSKQVKSKRLVLKEDKSLLDFLYDKIKFNRGLSQLYIALYERVYIFSNDDVECKYKTLKIIVLYFISSLTIFLLFIINFRVWYAILLFSLVSFLVPFILLTFYFEKKIMNTIKDLPLALEELEINFIKTSKLKDAIDLSLDNIPKSMVPIFNILSYNMLKDSKEAIDIFRRMFHNEYMNAFCSLIEIYIDYGGDISGQIHQLLLSIQEDINNTKNIKSSLIVYKILALLVLLSIPILITALKNSSEMFQEYYSAISGTNNTMFSILLVTFYIVFIQVLEYL